MPSRKNILSVCFSLLSLSYAWLFVATCAPETFGPPAPSAPAALQALLIGQKITLNSIPWKSYSPEDLDIGFSAPVGTNVIFTIPYDVAEIRREVLLGGRGKDTRYWGYCFDNNYDYDPKTPIAASGFPGKLYLSEAERAWRKAREEASKPVYTIYNPPKKGDLEAVNPTNQIRHQVEIFKAGTTCYLMTEKTLPLGTDRDGDGLNAQLEKKTGTSPTNIDSDSDGNTDGVEVLIGKTDPLRRDSDGDGLIDGIEDKNHDGITQIGETDPLKKDTDSDELCDGYCRQFSQNLACPAENSGENCKELLYGRWMGEDKNLNGKIDTGETDPRLWSSGQNGISDLQQYYKCILAGGKDC